MPRRSSGFVACVWLLANLACAAPARADASPLQSVSIRAQLDPVRHVIRGVVVQRLRNTTSVALGRMVFHLYLEAFRDRRSVFMRESGGALRGVRVQGAAGQRLLSLRIDGADALGRADRELVPGDTTQLSVPLLTPLPPGATTHVEIAFEATLPELAARAGYLGDFHVLAQWFPKLAKLEADGSWASFPYHGNGEFYADFATYDVELEVPRGYSVEGTGERVAHRARGERDVHRFRADRVHDAAYVVAEDLVIHERRCVGVRVRVAHTAGFALAADEHARATCAGLASLGAWLGPYPYPTLAVVVPPRGASGGAGMEYPTAFLTDGPWFPTAWFPAYPAIETTFHELAHQWFQGLVANDEVTHPMLDEGLASYVGYEALARFRGDRAPDANPSWRDELVHESLRPFVARADVPRPSLPAHAYDAYGYGTSVYGRSAAVFETLARIHGRARVDAAIGRYAREQRYRHPRPSDLLAAFEHELGPAVAAQLEALLIRGERITVRVERLSAVRLRAVRSGPLDVPLELEIRNGTLRRRLLWQGSARFELALGSGPGPRCLVVDPDRRSLLDDRRVDDVGCLERPRGRLDGRLRGLLAFVLRGLAP